MFHSKRFSIDKFHQVYQRKHIGKFKFTSKVYGKPMAIERFIRFDSHHPLTMKRGLIKCLTTRARKLFSTEESEKD